MRNFKGRTIVFDLSEASAKLGQSCRSASLPAVTVATSAKTTAACHNANGSAVRQRLKAPRALGHGVMQLDQSVGHC